VARSYRQRSVLPGLLAGAVRADTSDGARRSMERNLGSGKQ
jgi:hypothetical protein